MLYSRFLLSFFTCPLSFSHFPNSESNEKHIFIQWKVLCISLQFSFSIPLASTHSVIHPHKLFLSVITIKTLWFDFSALLHFTITMRKSDMPQERNVFLYFLGSSQGIRLNGKNGFVVKVLLFVLFSRNERR